MAIFALISVLLHLFYRLPRARSWLAHQPLERPLEHPFERPLKHPLERLLERPLKRPLKRPLEHKFLRGQ